MTRKPAVTSRRRTLHVPRELAGERLDRFLARALPASPERTRALIAGGHVRIRGKTCSPHPQAVRGRGDRARSPGPGPGGGLRAGPGPAGPVRGRRRARGGQAARARGRALLAGRGLRGRRGQPARRVRRGRQGAPGPSPPDRQGHHRVPAARPLRRRPWRRCAGRSRRGRWTRSTWRSSPGSHPTRAGSTPRTAATRPIRGSSPPGGSRRGAPGWPSGWSAASPGGRSSG